MLSDAVEMQHRNSHFAQGHVDSWTANFDCYDRIQRTYSSFKRYESWVLVWEYPEETILDTKADTS